jgi:hypothetical protein
MSQDLSSILDKVNWEGLKLRGEIAEKKSHRSFVVAYQKKHLKNFTFAKFGGREGALSAAREYRQEICVRSGWVRNEYGFFVSDNGEQVGIVKLTRGTFMLFSRQHLPLVVAHTWCARDDTLRWYAESRVNGKISTFHRLVLPGAKMIDHINHDGLDNRVENLRVADASLNTLNSRMSMSRNTSGRRGVGRRRVGPLYYWFTQMMVNGKTQTKFFSIKKLGENGAYVAACAYREEAEKKYGVSSI